MANDNTAPRGTLIAGRFTVEELAGSGGMGSVYRALDTSTGRPVALKLLHSLTSPEAAYRFNREAAVLSGLRHPGIVSYVAHGAVAGQPPFLAMEWLAGEDLTRRLEREPLCLSEVVSLVRRAAEALAVAHRQGIVHRDLKPSNLMLRAGCPEDVVLLDFGLARSAVPSLMGVTGAGAVVGTPGYMAPEQASSQPELLPSADIFSLGCVLYECLTGQPPFAAPHPAATLAKILYAEPLRLHALRPGLPTGLQVLVDRMLAKDPKRRVADADGLLEALAALEPVPELLPPHAELAPRLVCLGGAEQQLGSVVLISAQGSTEGVYGAEASRGVALRDALRVELLPYGGRVELLADGSLVVTLLPERATATDQVALAARCALTFKDRWPEASVVLSTGLGVFNERLPVGEAMDRAGRMLRLLEDESSSWVVLDEVSAGLLGAGFQVARWTSSSFELRGEQVGSDESRPLLGKPTPCVGREQELALLDFTLNSCIEEPGARALLVTAPAGVGKSRLRHEFLRRVERREQPTLVLLGRGDPMSTGASYGLLGQALRRMCRITEGDGLEEQRTRLYQCVARYLPETEVWEVAEFLAELCGIPLSEEGSPGLCAARADPHLMSTRVARALVAFFGAECAHHPVLLVLEDLHWSDVLTVRLVDEMLRGLAEQPFMVLALARPEVKRLFPHLWSKLLQELPLRGLGHKAGVRLVREVLGPRVPEAMVRKVVEQSDGNALFLEELIRVVAEGRGEAVPETVLAVLQARLMRMESGARQVLLVASIFGRAFWLGGVGELLGRPAEAALLEQHLRLLVEQEVIEPRPDSRFPTMPEYRFRHALVRDAAYGLVPDSHRVLGHQLAGAWLERLGEPDALVLATHSELGRQPERAAHFFTQAAERLFERNDLQGTMRCVEAALSCGVSGEALTQLRALQAVAFFWMAQLSMTLECGMPALAGLRAGSPLWCRLTGGLNIACAQEGRQAEAAWLEALLLHTTPEPEALAAYVEALNYFVVAAVWSGDRQKVDVLLGRLLKACADSTTDALARGWMGWAKAYVLYLLEARPWQTLQVAEAGMRDFLGIGSERNANLMRSHIGGARLALGDVSGGVQLLRELLDEARRTEQGILISSAHIHLFQTMADSPEPEHQREARDLALEWVGLEDPGSLMKGMAYAVLAKVTAASGELREAELHARTACEVLAPFKPYQGFARVVLSGVLRARGSAAEARQVAELGVGELERMGGAGVYAVALYLALTEACVAQNEVTAGDEALRKALRCVWARADDIPDAEARERFLRQVPENARALELARQRWGEAAA